MISKWDQKQDCIVLTGLYTIDKNLKIPDQLDRLEDVYGPPILSYARTLADISWYSEEQSGTVR